MSDTASAETRLSVFAFAYRLSSFKVIHRSFGDIYKHIILFAFCQCRFTKCLFDFVLLREDGEKTAETCLNGRFARFVFQRLLIFGAIR